MDDLSKKRADAVKAARAVIDAAKSDSRDLTPEEQETVEGYMTEVKALDVQMKGRALVSSVMDLGAVADNEPNEVQPTGGAKTLGEHYAKTIGLEGLRSLKSRSGYSVATPEFKAATDPNDTSGADMVPLLTEYDRTIVRGFREAPVVADLLGSGTISGNSISYLVEGAVEGAFTTVAEGAAKPQMHFVNPTAEVDSLTKIAAWWDTTDEMVEDLPFMVSEINTRGLYLLSTVEEQQLLNGGGTGTDLTGILNRSGIQTETQAVAPDTAQDAIFRAMMKVQTATGLVADGIVMHPSNYQDLRLAKDGNDQYYGGGFFTGQYGTGGLAWMPPLWGLRTVVTSAIAADTVLVGAFRQGATVYRKGGIRVESTNSDLGKFTSNLITTRIEERLALAVRVPAAFVDVTLL